MKRALVWFKTDLRLTDNETLMRAIAENDQLIPVYCFDDSHFEKNEFGFLKTGKFRTQFLIESVADLESNLRKIGSGLLVVKGNPIVEISKIAQAYHVSRVYAKKEVAFEEKNLEAQLEKELWKTRCTLETFSTSTLYHAEDLPFSIKDIPDVFTQFRKKVEKESSIRPIFETPTHISSPTILPSKIPTVKELLGEKIVPDSRQVLDFKGGETTGIARVRHYFDETKAISAYKETRNGLLGADYSSKFSPWLALGCLSPREIAAQLKTYENEFGANDSTYWLIFELLWRDYFRFIMKKHRNKLFQQAGIKSEEGELKSIQQTQLERWINGETGNDFIDANMIELQRTGFMSNRGRQNVASYFCNDLNLDWRYGAAYFEQQLIDYDVCSNWGNWAYLAGVGTDPRGQRVFNIEKQASDYDKNRAYRNTWLKVKV